MRTRRSRRMKPLYAKRRGSGRKLPPAVYARRIVTVVILAGVAVALLIGAGIALVWTGSLFASRNPAFEIRHIEYESDGRLAPGLLREYAGLQEGGNLFGADVRGAVRRLRQVPMVEMVTVERMLPDRILIRVTERTPVAQIQWSRRGIPYLIDQYGVVLPSSRTGQALPLIHGRTFDDLRPGDRMEDTSVRQCIELIKEADRLGLGSRLILGPFDVRNSEFVTVTVNRRVSARFPHHSAREKLIRLASVLQVAEEQGRRIRTVDLTPGGRNVPVTYD